MKLISVTAIGTCVISMAADIAQGNRATGKIRLLTARCRNTRSGQYEAAERDCREIVKQNPSDILAQIYLGQSLYMQKKYAESVAPFEKARELEASGMKLNSAPSTDIVFRSASHPYGISRH